MSKLHSTALDIATTYSVDPFVIKYVRSCFYNLKLSRSEMIERQNNSIREIHSLATIYERAIEKRQSFIEKYPEDAEHHRNKLLLAQQQLAGLPKNEEKRVRIKIFLESISDEEFKKVVQI